MNMHEINKYARNGLGFRNCQKFMNMHEINKYALNGLGIMNMQEMDWDS